MRIVSHNAFWFQGVPFTTDRPGAADEGVLAALVAVYRGLGPDVLAVQEIQDARTFDRLGGALGMAGTFCRGAELPQYGGGTFWRSGILLADSRQAGAAPQRMWQVVRVPAGQEALVICHVHLPSGRQLGLSAAGARRRAELRTAMGQTDPPGVVLGDFNEAPGGPLSGRLARAGYVDAADAAQDADRPTGPGGGRGDQIWVHRNLQGRLAGYGVLPAEAMGAQQAGKQYLSDHFPVWIELDT